MSRRACCIAALFILSTLGLALPAQAELIDAGTVHRIDESLIHWSFMPDGAVLTVDSEGILAVNSIDEGILSTVWQLDLNVSAITVEPDKSYALIAVGHTEGTLIVSSTQQAVNGWINDSGRVDSIAWGLDGNLWLGMSSGDRRANEYSADGQNQFIHTTQHSGGLTDVVVLADGRIATSGYDDLVNIHYDYGGLNKTLNQFEDPVTSMLLTTDDELVVATSSGELYIFDTTTWVSKELQLSDSQSVVTMWQNGENSLMISTNSNLYTIWINVWGESSFQSISGGSTIGGYYGEDGELYMVSVLSSSTLIRLYDVDDDGDDTPNSQDDFPDDSTQTKDSDGDGYGDNPSGNMPDRWPDDPNEWNDTDNDGVGDNSDAFPDNSDQTTDTDGDGYGDNQDGEQGDRYPQDETQWRDSDYDTYGDEPTGANPDSCPQRNGDSTEDRNGCPDSDNDGWSNADDNWTIEDGADAFRNDKSQWKDADGDGYGDNPAGNKADICPQVVGNSTKAWLAIKQEGSQDVVYSEIEYYGCTDSDGDGWADLGDDMPQDPTEYIDADHDGLGASLDYDDNSALIKTLEDHCLVNSHDTTEACKGVRDTDYQAYLESVEGTPKSYSSWNKSQNSETTTDSSSDSDMFNTKALQEAGLVGGGVFVLMMFGLLVVVMMQKRKRRSQLIKTYGVPVAPVSNSSEAEVLGFDTDVREIGGIEESDSWDDEIAPLQIGGDGMSEFEEDASNEVTAVDYSESSSIEELAGVTSQSEPEQQAPETTETPEAPPIPEEGLPPGWTMDQWQWYGAQWLAANKE